MRIYIYHVPREVKKIPQFTSVRHTSSIKIIPNAFSSPGNPWSLNNLFPFTSNGVTVNPSLTGCLISSAVFLLVSLKITYISKQKVYMFPDVSLCSSVNN